MPNTTEHQSNTPEKYIHHIIDLAKTQVRDTEAYRELLGRGASHPDAFRQTAHSVAEQKGDNLTDADRTLLHITADLGVFVQAEQELRLIGANAENRYLDADEKQVMQHLKREYAIPFNHHLKEFINTHPNDDIRTVSSALTNAYGTIFGRYSCIDRSDLIYGQNPEPREAHESVQAALDGMRHEIAAESLLEAADYSYDFKVSNEEDARGADLFVYLESGWEAIDIKASQASVARAQGKNRFSRAVWTGLDWGDFTGLRGTGHGMLSIPYATALAKSDQFITNIRRMVTTQNAQRTRTTANLSNSLRNL